MNCKSVIPLSEVKRRLKEKTVKELIKIISECYKVSNESRFYISTELIENKQETENIINELREELSIAFWGKKKTLPPPVPNLRKAKKTVSDLKKVTDNPEIIIQFMLGYIDHGIMYSCEYGDMWEQYYDSIENMFQHMTKMIVEHNEQINVWRIIKETEDVIWKSSEFGWGLYDNLTDWTEELKEKLEINS